MHVINIAKIHEHPKYRQIELSMWIRCTYTISNLVRFLLKILKFSYIFIRLKVVLSFFLTGNVRSSAYACVLRYRRICRLLLRARQRLIGKRETKMDSRNQTVQTRHTLFHCGNTHRLASFRGGHNERLCEYG